MTANTSVSKAGEKLLSLRGLGLALVNVALAACFLLFAYANSLSFIENPRLSVLLIVITETIVAVLLIVRRDPSKTWHTWQTWVTTTAGTFLPLLLRPVEFGEDLLIGQILQIAGTLMQIGALAALGRSLGLLPAHRGIKSAGMYRFVRHPLYASYLLTFAGYLICNPTAANVVVVVLGVGCLMLRIRYEEELLLQYPSYATYVGQTRWRLIPSVW